MNRLGAVLAAILVAGACAGWGQTAPHGAASRAPSPSPSLVSAADAGLKVISADGPNGGPPGGIRCPLWLDRTNQLVLADGTQLDAALVSRLRQQADALWPSMGSGRRASDQMPDGLRSVPGVLTSGPVPWPPSNIGLGGTNYFYGPGCTLVLQVTNVGQSAVQVPSAGFRLTQASEPNTQRYDLVDRCSLVTRPPLSCLPQLGGGAGECSVYMAQVQLAAGSASATFEDTPVSTGRSGPCPTLTIAPAATAVLWILAVSTAPLVYHAVPVLTVDTSRGRLRVGLTELVGTLAFADPSQFACWKLQGSTFVKALEGPGVLPAYVPNQAPNYGGWRAAGVWCV